MFAISLFVLSQLGGEFIPELEEGDFAVETRILTGSNLTTTIEYTQKSAAILKSKFPEVKMVVTKIGSGEVPTDPMPVEASDMMVILKDKEEWTSAKTFAELAKKMSSALEEVPGVFTSFQYPVQMRFNELMTGARQDVVCKLFGENLDTLSVYAKKLSELVKHVEGAEDLYVETVTGIPQIVIAYNRAAISQYNLTITDINRVINTAFAGQIAGSVYEGEKRFDLVLRLQGEKRQSLEDIRNVLIPTPAGTQIPLNQLAKVEIKNGPNQIQREDAKRRIVVGFNVRGRDVQSIVDELKNLEKEKLHFPSGYFLTYGGAFENLKAAKQRLMIAVPISLILIFFLLYFAFHSFREGLLIYSAIPLSAIGGILFLALRGMPFSISAGIGFIALFGVAVLNGIVLIAEFNRLKSEGLKNNYRIVMKGTVLRLRPVLMTAFVASVGFLPMALSNGAGAEVQRPLATVVIGGLLVATFLTLFVLPVLFLRFTKTNSPIKLPRKIKGLVFLFSVLPFLVQSQNPIGITAAMDTALVNNLSLKQEQLKKDYFEKLTHAAFDLPKTSLSGEFGQINSYYSDNRFGVLQGFNFPTVYINQKQILNEEWKISESNVLLKEADIRKLVRQVFYNYLFLMEKQNLLMMYDSVYLNILNKANQRFKEGESDVLEKTIAEHQKATLSIQLKQIEQQLVVTQLEFSLILNSTVNYIPFEEELKMNVTFEADPVIIKQHPSLKIREQQKSMASMATRLERSKLLPDFNLAYYNMTMKGLGADDKYYTSNRFQSVQVGIGIPLFFGTQKAKLSASKVNQNIAEMNLMMESKSIQNNYESLLLKYEAQLSAVNYFETKGLKNAEIIKETAYKKLTTGEINYLQWVMLNNQSITIRSNYIDAVKELNETGIELNYLINK